MKKLVSVLICALLIAACLTGCSGSKDKDYFTKGYSDETLIIGYTESVSPFLEVDKEGRGSGFMADVFKAIFSDVKGDLKNYRFEKVEEGYTLEKDGGFTDKEGTEYSAGLLMGAVSKNSGTFNEDFSFTEPIITNRVIAVTAKNSKVKSYADFAGANIIVTGETAKASYEKQKTLYYSAKVTEAKTIDEALAALDSGKADAVVCDEFTFNPSGKAENYAVLEGELDTVEYVIACAKYSGWKDSINNAIYELKSPNYNDKDEFTPIVEKYFGYNASSFDYNPED